MSIILFTSMIRYIKFVPPILKLYNPPDTKVSRYFLPKEVFEALFSAASLILVGIGGGSKA